MKFRSVLFAALWMATTQCADKPYHLVAVDNPAFSAPKSLIGYEDLTSPKFEALKSKYQLDTIFHGETDELKRILLLRNWIRKVIEIDNIGPFPGDGSAESILDEALKGHGFHCAHYMAVQHAIMNAYGYVTRYVKADEGDLDALEGHHGINEVWLNSYHKWFLSDTKYNYHFEKNGIPLSALEIRDEYFKNKAKDILLMKGPDRTPTEVYPELKNRTKELFARIFTWVSWDKYNSPYSKWPQDSSNLVMYSDDYSRNHTWLREGKPHWAYNTRYLEYVADRKEIEWTPNTITANVAIHGNKASIDLNSITPNLKTYQMRALPESEWKDVPASVELELKKDSQETLFRTVNAAGVTGPEYRVAISR